MRRTNADLARELDKVHEVVTFALKHFRAEAEMNAALHMSPEVRPAPLAAAIDIASHDLARIYAELMESE